MSRHAFFITMQIWGFIVSLSVWYLLTSPQTFVHIFLPIAVIWCAFWNVVHDLLEYLGKVPKR